MGNSDSEEAGLHYLSKKMVGFLSHGGPITTFIFSSIPPWARNDPRVGPRGGATAALAGPLDTVPFSDEAKSRFYPSLGGRVGRPSAYRPKGYLFRDTRTKTATDP